MSTWLGKAPEKMQLHHLGFSFVKFLIEDLEEVPHQNEMENLEKKTDHKRSASHCNVV